MRRLVCCCVLGLVLAACGSGTPTASTQVTRPPTPAATLTTVVQPPATSAPTAEPATTTTDSTASSTTVAIAEPTLDSYFSLTGDNPSAFPSDWSIGFMGMATEIADIETAFGPPRAGDSDAVGQSFSWDLPGSSLLSASAIVTPSGLGPLGFIEVEIPPDSPVRFGLAGGVVLGKASLDDLRQAWGEPVTCDAIGKSDCQVLYARCLGSADLVAPMLVCVGTAPHIGTPTDWDWSDRIWWLGVAENQSPQAWQQCVDLELSSDGLGVADLGSIEDEAMLSLAMTLGPSSMDWIEEWDEPIGIKNGYPANLRFRQVEWDDLGLAVVFSDGVTWPDGRDGSVLISWSYFGTPDAALVLTDENGFTIGSPATDVIEAYGGDLTVAPADEYFGWRAFEATEHPGAGPDLAGLTFEFDGDPANHDSLVIRVSAGSEQAP